MKKDESLIGTKLQMNNGQYAICVAYRKPQDIDVQFEDDTIVRTTKYQFLKGEVKNPNFWIGKSNRMFNGQTATIIAYRGYYDIDVQFEDGTIVKHRAIDKFKSGSITSPNCNSSTKASVLNVEVVQNNGQKAKCIAYRTNVDIDIQFEDGTIVYHKQKASFLRGEIKNPKFNKFSIVGKTVLQNCGMKATCIRYAAHDDIDVQFEDGTIVKHTRKDYFVNGSLQNPNYDPFSCLGETRAMLNGQQATCIAYRRSDDIDVQFEDGTVVCHRQKASFLRGEISNPNYDPYSCEGETRLMNNGMNATCIAYRNSEDIDVRFEDGTIVEHKVKSAFYAGAIANPNILSGSLPEQIIYYFLKKHFKKVDHNYRPNWLKNPVTKNNLEIDIWIPSLCVGVEYDGVKWHEKETQKSAMKAELITKSNEIKKIYTFLEKGCVIHNGPKHINYCLSSTSNVGDYNSLLKELEKYLNILLNQLGIEEKAVLTEELLLKIKSSKIVKEEFKSFEQETHMMSCGLKATIIAYRRSNDIDIEFEDGEIVRHKKLDSFRKGHVANPKLGRYQTIRNKSSCLGLSIKQKCGMIGTCIAYRKSQDIDVQFEDGTIVTNKSKEKFLKGNVGYPPEKKYLNLTKTMNSGEKATIICYKRYIDIDVQFEDGTIVYNRKCDEFLNGGISNPNKKNKDGKQKKNLE